MAASFLVSGLVAAGSAAFLYVFLLMWRRR